MDQAVVALHQVALAIRNRVTDATEQASGVPLRWRLQDAAELMTYGEAVIGLENLCSNLYEFDVPLRESDYERIEAAGEALELPETTWTMLGIRWSQTPNRRAHGVELQTTDCASLRQIR